MTFGRKGYNQETMVSYKSQGRIRNSYCRFNRLVPRFCAVILLLTLSNRWVLFSYGFSSPLEPSPWASSSWLLHLDFGKPTNSKANAVNDGVFLSNSSPFSAYGSSGSRLAVTCPVVIEAEEDPYDKEYRDPFVATGASVIRARTNDDQGDPTEERKKNLYFVYSSMEGQRRMEFSPGGWTLQFPPGGIRNKGRASKLRFYFDLTTDLKRNDVVLPSGTRLYFAASAWRETNYEKGLDKILPLRQALENAQRILDEQLSHESGDRRLDGTDPIETLKAYGDMTTLVMDRDRKRMLYRDALDQDGHGYPASDDHPEGPWPGTTEWLTISENNPIYARIPKDGIPDASSDENENSKNFLQQLIRGTTNDYYYGRVGSWNAEAISTLLLDEDGG